MNIKSHRTKKKKTRIKKYPTRDNLARDFGELPRVGLVASKENQNIICPLLSQLNVSVVTFSPNVGVEKHISQANLFALVIKDTPPNISFVYFLERIRKIRSLKETPFIVILNEPDDDMASKLYDCGASLVLDFRNEKDIIGQLIVEYLGVRLAKGKTTDAERRLSRSVRAHLKTLRPIYGRLKNKVQRGNVDLRGNIDFLWKKRELKQYIEKIPGVRSVNLNGVSLLTKAVSDFKIKAQIRELLRSQPNSVAKTITPVVRNSIVTLLGKTQSPGDLSELIKSIETIEGVRKVENRVSTSEFRN